MFVYLLWWRLIFVLNETRNRVKLGAHFILHVINPFANKSQQWWTKRFLIKKYSSLVYGSQSASPNNWGHMIRQDVQSSSPHIWTCEEECQRHARDENLYPAEGNLWGQRSGILRHHTLPVSDLNHFLPLLQEVSEGFALPALLRDWEKENSDYFPHRLKRAVFYRFGRAAESHWLTSECLSYFRLFKNTIWLQTLKIQEV